MVKRRWSFAWSVCCWNKFTRTPWYCCAPLLAFPWPDTAGTELRSAAMLPWPATIMLRHTSAVTTSTIRRVLSSRSRWCPWFHRRTHRRRALAAPVLCSATALFRVTDSWGPLTSGSHRSATVWVCYSSFDPVFEFFCDFYIFHLIAPKIVK